MIFTPGHAQMVLGGRKTQTRRPVKPGEYPIVRGPGLMEWRWHPDIQPLPANAVIIEVRDRRSRVKWRMGDTLAVQVGRGKKAIGRTPPIKAIRRERLRDIRWRDVKAEGVDLSDMVSRGWNRHVDARHRFYTVWQNLYRKPYDWESNPLVWVLEFEKAAQGE